MPRGILYGSQEVTVGLMYAKRADLPLNAVLAWSSEVQKSCAVETLATVLSRSSESSYLGMFHSRPGGDATLQLRFGFAIAIADS